MKKQTRREFLQNTVVRAGAGAVLTVMGGRSLFAAEPVGETHGYGVGKFAIELDGIMAGWVQSAEGGHATSDVVTEKLGADSLSKKHVAGVKYEDITVNCGTGMSKAFYEWIKASFDGQAMRKNGAIVACDFNFNEVSRMEFFNALISEIALPALDASSKDAAKMTIKLSPEITRMVAKSGGGAKISGMQNLESQKRWLPSNFRLQIAGLDCTRVNKIEAIVVKQKIVENPVGEMRNYEKEPAHAEVPNLVVTLAEDHSSDWMNWHNSFIVNGHDHASQEKTGELVYLTPDLRETLFTVQFQNLGIFKISPDPSYSRDGIRRVRAEMYSEHMTFNYGNVWA